jgi:hypothetical protein
MIGRSDDQRKKLRVRYPAALLFIVSVVTFLGWPWSNWVLVDVGMDLK